MTESKLSAADRKYLIAGMIGEYEYQCHEDAEDTDMEPAEHYAELMRKSDSELLEESELLEGPFEDAKDYYKYHSAWIPAEYSL